MWSCLQQTPDVMATGPVAGIRFVYKRTIRPKDGGAILAVANGQPRTDLFDLAGRLIRRGNSRSLHSLADCSCRSLAGDILILELGHANPDPDLGAGLR